MSNDLLVKYCPACGEENLPSESFCTACDFDLLSVPSEARRDGEAADPAPTAAATEAATPWAPAEMPVPAPEQCRLESLENPEIAFVIASGQSVGRGVEADVILQGVPHLAYISRRHALFSMRNQQWFVQYVATGNFIKVDGETYEDDTQVAVNDGSVVTLSMTSFRVALS
jgi:hypothetical protein